MSTVENKIPADILARDRALQPDVSFIVQAPAGSGKTGLLTQRYLKLLSIIDKPEEVIAITFTRKAAGEMRDRILSALQFASVTDVEPVDEYDKKTWQLASAALKQDVKNNWNLLEHSGRLRVQTIDSLCTELARQLPLLSEFGAIPGIVDDANNLYYEASLETLSYLESKDPEYQWAAEALEKLLQHQDNRMDKVQELIASMLNRRDQWLRHVADIKHQQLNRDQIEPVLKRIVEDGLLDAFDNIPENVRKQLPELIRFAAEFAPKDSSLKLCLEFDEIPEPSVENLEHWIGITELLLTNDNNWRKPKGVNKKIGFLAATEGEDKEQKELFIAQKKKIQALLEELDEQNDAISFKEKLAHIRILPHYFYTDKEWDILGSLFKILLFSAAQLRIVFSSHGQVDFIEMLLAAKRALGDSEQPTDLSLKLDYQLKHLLVDEFQDTSQNQFDLFTQLTSGWQADDGRTLFLVGDPMQSIYRFREAEVGLFLQAWNSGVGDVVLEPLNLTVNFRSNKAIIDWVNEKFPVIFPSQDDKTSGSVKYTDFEAFKPDVKNSLVKLHPIFNRDDNAEAELIIDLIEQAKKDIPQGRIAILCRNKSHLAEIVSLLNSKTISYQAVEIGVLNKQPVIQDLLSLTKALLHLADRISWLALLRAPFIGLTLNDIHSLTSDNNGTTIYQSLTNKPDLSKLSEDGRFRLERVLPVLEVALNNIFRNNLRSWVEGVWMAIGGPACCSTETVLADAEVYFQLLESLDSEKEILDAESLDMHCRKLYALADLQASDEIQLMTIHKSKGLEFETVIIPGLGKSTASDKSQLLYWCERTSPDGYPELVFGPIKAAWDQSNKTTEYLKFLESQKVDYEVSRLLYVAVTRAKQSLHLLGHVSLKTDGQMAAPASRSLLAQLWPVAERYFVKALASSTSQAITQIIDDDVELDESEGSVLFSNTSRQRLVKNWRCPKPPLNIDISSSDTEVEVEDLNLEFDWASETALHVGSVVHRILEQLSIKDVSESKKIISQITLSSKIMLIRLGVVDEQLDTALHRVITSVKNILDDPRGQWILSNKHLEAKSEYKITAELGGEVKHLIIDRTFIDEHGVRWVIDYKTGNHEGGGLDEFLDREQQRYESQLQRYAEVMKLLDGREVRMALYFPMMQQWREW